MSDKFGFEKIIADGDREGAAGGFVQQTANGTGQWRGTGWNWVVPYSSPQVPPDPTRPLGRNNRTAE